MPKPIAATKSPSDRLIAVVFGALGLFLVISWAIFPVPTRDELTEVSGVLASYSIEADQSWFARHLARRRSVHVLFKVADHHGRFWSDAVDPENVRSIFSREDVVLSFYHPSSPIRFRGLFNGDGEKTYGLRVNGTQLQSVDDAVMHDTIWAHYVLPAMGVVILGMAGYWWRNPRP